MDATVSKPAINYDPTKYRIVKITPVRGASYFIIEKRFLFWWFHYEPINVFENGSVPKRYTSITQARNVLYADIDSHKKPKREVVNGSSGDLP